VAAGFSSQSAFAAAMDAQPAHAAPSQSDVAALVKVMAAEVGACRPATTWMLSGTSGGTGGAAGTAVDMALLAVVARGVQSAAKQFAARAEAAAAAGAAVTAVAQHFMPTPSQLFNFQLCQRCEEVRRGLVRVAADLPLGEDVVQAVGLPVLESVPPTPPRLPHTSAATAFHPPLPAPLHGLHVRLHADASAPMCVVQCPQALLLSGVLAISAVTAAVISAWIPVVVTPLERQLLRLHDVPYSGGGGGIATEAVQTTPGDGLTNQADRESDYVSTVAAMAAALAVNQLSQLPSGPIAEAARAAVAARCMTLYVRHVVMVRPVDEAGKARISRDGTALDAALAPLLPEAARLGRLHGEMRAVRALPQTTSHELLHAATGTPVPEPPASDRVVKLQKLLRTLRPATLYHALLARLPPECDMPHAHTKRTLTAYSAWLDALLVGGGDGGDGAGAADSALALLFVDEPGWKRVDAAVRDVALRCIATWQERATAAGSDAAATIAARAEVALVRDFDPAALPPPRREPVVDGEGSSAAPVAATVPAA